MAAADTARIIEQLLKRFEALRLGGPVKVLAEDTTAERLLATFFEELPPGYQEFFGAGKSFGTRYGKPRKGRQPAMCFRLLGQPADICRLIKAAEAAGQLLKGRLSQAHLVKAKELQGANGKANQAAWFISMFNAAAGRQLATDGLAGGDWFLWHREAGIVVAESTVERYRNPRPAAEAPLAAIKELAECSGEPEAYAVIEDAAETSVALLHWLAERWEGQSTEEEGGKDAHGGADESKKYPTKDILKAMWAREDTKEKLLGMTVRQLEKEIGRSASGIAGNKFWIEVVAPERELRKAKRQLNNYVIGDAQAPPEDRDLGQDVQ